MIITISGVSGSGKSSVAKTLAKMLGYKHYSMGDLQREIAHEKGLSILELGELEKKDDKIDRMIDKKQAELGNKEDNFVIDSWLGAKFIPQAYKVFLDAELEVRAKRIFNAKRGSIESYSNVEETKNLIQKRDKINRERWLDYYDFDFTDYDNYDLVIDTSHISIEEIAEMIRQKSMG